jgi:hypothetical protein
MFGSLVGDATGGRPDMMAFFNNPALMNMFCKIIICPYEQILFINYFYRMTNLVTNLSGTEGGQVGLETLLQT